MQVGTMHPNSIDKSSNVQEGFWNIPNTLTVFRLATLPAVVLCLDPSINNPTLDKWAAILFAFGAALDALDGYLARRLNQITTIGKFLDPLADKIYYLVTCIALLACIPARLPAWLIMVILVRELTINGLRIWAASERIVIPAGTGGKIKTALTMLGVTLILLPSQNRIFTLFPSHFDTASIGILLMYVGTAIGVWSGADYIRKFLAQRHA